MNAATALALIVGTGMIYWLLGGEVAWFGAPRAVKWVGTVAAILWVCYICYTIL